MKQLLQMAKIKLRPRPQIHDVPTPAGPILRPRKLDVPRRELLVLENLRPEKGVRKRKHRTLPWKTPAGGECVGLLPVEESAASHQDLLTASITGVQLPNRRHCVPIPIQIPNRPMPSQLASQRFVATGKRDWVFIWHEQTSSSVFYQRSWPFTGSRNNWNRI